MDTVTINAEEWKETVRKIDRIAEFVEQYAEWLPADNEAWLNETQVCDYLKISPKTLQRLRNSGDIKYSTIAKKHYYKAIEIKALLERKSVKSGREQLEKLKKSCQKHSRK